MLLSPAPNYETAFPVLSVPKTHERLIADPLPFPSFSSPHPPPPAHHMPFPTRGLVTRTSGLSPTPSFFTLHVLPVCMSFRFPDAGSPLSQCPPGVLLHRPPRCQTCPIFLMHHCNHVIAIFTLMTPSQSVRLAQFVLLAQFPSISQASSNKSLPLRLTNLPLLPHLPSFARIFPPLGRPPLVPTR